MLICAVHILLTSLLLFSSQVAARLPDGRLSGNHPPLPLIPRITELEQGSNRRVKCPNGTEIAPYDKVYYFDQLIDHSDPSKGTFKMRYWATWEFYKPGGPIVLLTPGEANGDSEFLFRPIPELIDDLCHACAFVVFWIYLTNQTISGRIAQEEGGAAVVLEHRFYGLSNPYPDLSVKSFEVHTVDQAIEDFDYFAKNVKLPFPGGDQVGPDKAPWIFVGGSYSGALASWLRVV